MDGRMKAEDFLAQKRIAVCLKIEGGIMNAQRRRMATITILVVDVAYIAWGGMAAAMPDGLLGPGGRAILPAAYDGYTGSSWAELLRTSPTTANYVVLMYRMYGVYCALFGMMASAIAATAFRRAARWAWWTLLVGNTVALVSAMRMDWIVNAVGPFELTEYLGLVAVWAALAMTHPFRGRPAANCCQENVHATV
jgi:hypothetical protein